MRLLLLFSTFVLCVFGYDPEMQAETVSVTVTDIEGNSKSRASHVALLDRLRVNIHRQHGNVTLVLERNINLQTDVPIAVERHGQIIYQDVNETDIVGFYHSLDPFAAVMTTKNKHNKQSTLQLMGDVKLHDVTYRLQFNHDSQDYKLLKLKSDEQDNQRTTIDRGIMKTDRYRTVTDGDIETPKNFSAEFFTFVNDREDRINKLLYEVEVMAVTDYTEYLFWLSYVTKSNPEMPFIYRDMVAKIKMKQYIAFILNGSILSSSWTDVNENDGYNVNQVDGDTMLSRFTDWCETNKKYLPGYDHAMLFTKHDVTAIVDGVVDKTVVGLAYTGDVCFANKQSLIQDVFGEDVALTVAHEIGHSLGAEHDGDHDFCLQEEEYIMSPVITHDRPDLRHHWQFSACSQYYFFRNFNNLNKLRLNCMSTRENNLHLSLQLTNKQPGQIYIPDEQCEYIYGQGSYLFRYGYQGDYTNICSTLKCTDPKIKGYHYNTDVMEGTNCGNGKLCRGGYCVEDEEASVGLKETCPFGDAPETYHGSQTQCARILQGTFWDAYKECNNYKHSCCETCSNLYSIYGLPTTPVVNKVGNVPAIGECITSCDGLMDGHYQSCRGCHVYTSCFANMMYDRRPCQRGLVWSDDLKRCEFTSNTCNIN